MKKRCRLAESSKEGYGSKRAIFPMITMMIMMMILIYFIYKNCSEVLNYNFV
jgi:hypothetical protein